MYETTVKSVLQEKAAAILQERKQVTQKTEVKAPMPGMILKIKKNLNEKISQGETVIILEAMKMENDLRAPRSGIIKEIFVNEGNAIEKGTVLFTIE
jgi:biotin carboxyl carrier protein